MLEGEQLIGRIRFAGERIPGVWLWNVTIHLTGGLPIGSARDFDTAKSQFKAAWTVLKAAAFRRRADQHQDALLFVLEACLEMDAIGPGVDVALRRQIALLPRGVFDRPFTVRKRCVSPRACRRREK